MAVTITAADLATAIRLGTSTEETAQATRLLAVATAIVERYAQSAPEAVQNQAVVQVAGYLYDQPAASQGAGTANALRNSGAASLLTPWRSIRAGTTAAAAAGDDSGSSAPDVPGGGGPGVDQTARNAAAAAQGTADAAQAAADAAQTSADNAQTTADAASTAAGAAQTAADAAQATADANTYTLPQATAAIRGGVRAVTNAIIDGSTGLQTIYGWSVGHVRRAATAAAQVVVNTAINALPAWVRVGATLIPVEKLDHGLAPTSYAMRVRWANAKTDLTAAYMAGGTLGTTAGVTIPDFSGSAIGSYLGVWIAADGSLITELGDGAENDLWDSTEGGDFDNPVTLTVDGVSGAIWRSNMLLDVATLMGTSLRATILPRHLGDAIRNIVRELVERWAERGSTNKVPLARLPIEANPAGEDGTDLTRLRLGDTDYNLPAGGGGGGGNPERNTIQFPAANYTYRTASQTGAGSGIAKWTAPYPAGTDQAAFTGKAKTGMLEADLQSNFDIGVPMTEFSNDKLAGYLPASAASFDRYTVDFNATEIVLQIPTDTDFPANQRDGWEVRITRFPGGGGASGDTPMGQTAAGASRYYGSIWRGVTAGAAAPAPPDAMTYTLAAGFGNTGNWSLFSPTGDATIDDYICSVEARRQDDGTYTVVTGAATQITDSGDALPATVTYYERDGATATMGFTDDSAYSRLGNGPLLPIRGRAPLQRPSLLYGELTTAQQSDSFTAQVITCTPFDPRDYAYIDFGIHIATAANTRIGEHTHLIPGSAVVGYSAAQADDAQRSSIFYGWRNDGATDFLKVANASAGRTAFEDLESWTRFYWGNFRMNADGLINGLVVYRVSTATSAYRVHFGFRGVTV